MTRPARHTLVLAAAAALLVAAAWARLCLGETLGYPGGRVDLALWRLLGFNWLLDADASAMPLTVLDLRLTRVVLAVVVGAALAASGVALQALLRNPLAEPFILGLSSGAAVGVMAQSLLWYRLQLELGANHVGALIGALLSMAVVYLVGRKRGVIDPLGLLLTGVVLATINGALVMLLNYMVGPGGLRDNLAHWMMGYLNEAVSGGTILLVAAVTGVGIALLAVMGRAMDVASFSETEAVSLGVNIALLRTLLFLIAGILAAGSVVLAGPIAFVGLICPHFMRALLGPGHRALVIGSALAGATLILAADIAAVLLDRQLWTGLMPVGVFTAMIGGPVFLWALRPQLGRDGNT
jgi:iron complex transport system permease protein